MLKNITYLFLLVLISCNPVKQVLKDNNKMKQVWEAGVMKDWCVNDTITKSDTSYVFDTLYNIETNIDTITVDSVKYITVDKVKTVVKTVTNTITNTVTDKSKEKLLQRDIDSLRSQIVTLKERVQEWKEKYSEMKVERNGWRNKFWFLVAAILIYLLRKPIGKLLKNVIKIAVVFSLFSFFSCENKSVPLEITDGQYPYKTNGKLFSFAIQDKYKNTNILSSKWRQVKGATVANIECPDCFETNVTGLTKAGIYAFELTVISSSGLEGKDTCYITVLSAVLTVDFVRINGYPSDDFNKIEWSYGTTEDVVFTVERSFDSYSFSGVHDVLSNHSGTSYYNDSTFQSFTYYRIKQTDKIGRHVYSEIIKVVNIPNTEQFKIQSPVYNTLNITFVSTKSQIAKIDIYNMRGQLVAQMLINAYAGFNRISQHIASLPSGIYLAILKTKSLTITNKFLKQ